MPLYRTTLRTLGAILLLVGALACKGKKSSDAASSDVVSISGTVTYSRVPLAKDSNGVPTGLADASVATNLQSLPARGVEVRLYQMVEETRSTGTKAQVWYVTGQTHTDSSGNYTVSGKVGRPSMVEILSGFSAGSSQSIYLISDPVGIGSATPALYRTRYGLRKAVDGTTSATDPVHATLPVGNTATLNFTVGLTDAWWIVDPTLSTGGDGTQTLSPTAAAAYLETTLPGRTAGTGSRILGIGDSIATFISYYASATPGASLALHYVPGLSDPRGSFVEYDPAVYPAAFTPGAGNSYLGAIRGAADNDDAWDEGVLFPLFARNFLYSFQNGSSSIVRTYAFNANPLRPIAAALPDQCTTLAWMEGLPEAMAANVLKSPYLADTKGTALAGLTDVRDLSGLTTAQRNPLSAPAIRALAWEVILKANGVTSPGTSAAWNAMNPAAAARFFAPAGYPTNSTTSRDDNPFSVFDQLGRLKEGKGTSEPVDLSAIFTDATLTALASPFGIPWPRPTTGAYASFVTDWGTDPNGLTTPLAPLAFSMSKAVKHPLTNLYPNTSAGEVAYAGFQLNADKRYALTVTISPALSAGGRIDVDVAPTVSTSRTFSFTGAGGSAPATIFPMASTTAPNYNPVRVRLVSPSVLQPDVAVTVSFVPSN